MSWKEFGLYLNLRAIGKSIKGSKPEDNMIWFTLLRKSLWLESGKWIRVGQECLQPLGYKLRKQWWVDYFPILFKITNCGEADLKTDDDTMWWASYERWVKDIMWAQQRRQIILTWRIRGSCTRRKQLIWALKNEEEPKRRFKIIPTRRNSKNKFKGS